MQNPKAAQTEAKNLLKRTLPDSRSKESEVSVIYQKLSNSGTVNVIGGKNRGDPEKPVSTVCFLCGLRELDTFLQSSLHLKKKRLGSRLGRLDIPFTVPKIAFNPDLFKPGKRPLL